MKLVPVDHDPFADAAPASGPQLVPVDHDPFAEPPKTKFGGIDAVAAGLPGDGAAAVGRGIINGVPVIGPYLLGGLNRAAAGVRALQNDTRYSDELARVERFGDATAKEHPWATSGGELGGGVVGTAPLVAAAPAAFGISAASLPVRAGASAFSGGALGGLDAAVRSEGDPTSTAIGAGSGFALGAASPYLGRAVGKVVSSFTGGGRGQGVLREALEGISEKDLESAQHLMRQGRELPGGPVELSLDEAVNAATGGQAARVSQLARVVANSGGEGGRVMNAFYARRPAAVDNAGRAALESIAPQNSAPTALGFDVQDAARAGIAQTAEGQALAGARAAAGPRITPEQAGRTIQEELGGIADGLLARRKAQAATDYEAARTAPDRVGIDRMVSVERPGEPIITPQRYSRPQFEPGAPEPLGPPPAKGPIAGAEPPSESLSRWLARNGGIPLDGEARAGDLNRFYQPGYGTLARREAPTWDQIRIRLQEDHFLPPGADGEATAASARDWVLDRLHQERIGRGRTVRIDDDPRQSGRYGAERDEFDHALSLAQERLDAGLRNAGVDPASVHPDIRSRALNTMVHGQGVDALDAFERVVMSMSDPPSPRIAPTTVTEQIPAPRFGQVDSRPAIEEIDRLLVTAKGNVRRRLAAIRRDLYEGAPDPLSGQREPDLTVSGVHQARERLDHVIKKAIEDGDGVAANRLQNARAAIDAPLKAAPEMAAADANFVANSRALEPFERSNGALGRVTAREQLPSGEIGPFRMPAEQVPGTVSGATSARDVLAQPAPASREALGRHVQTQILDKAAGANGDLSAEALRTAMREHADVLDQLPNVRDGLSRIVLAREGMARIEASPLGRVADSPDVGNAVRTLFAANPAPGSHGEVSAAMRALSANRPQAARELSRIYLESVFNEATQATKGLAQQYGGAGFASAIRGNAQQRHNLEAVVAAMPEGETIWKGLDTFLTTLEATGYRPVKGSDTAFNQVIQERLKNGAGPLAASITEAATNAAAGGGLAGPGGAIGGAVVGIKKGTGHAWADRKRRINSEALARLLTDPSALPDLRALSKSPPGSKNAELFTQRLLTLANGGASPVRETAPAR